jgi:hypothetical protein
MPAVEKMYRWHAGAERWLRDREPAARVGLLYSQQTAHYYRGPVTEAVNGMYHALIEARVPFEMVHEGRLENLQRFKLLVLPNIAALSGAQCEAIAAFAGAGGSLLATFETSLYDEWGNPRPDFALGGTLGIRRKGGVLGPLRNSYLAFQGKPGARHPILAGFDDAAYTVNALRAVDAEAAGAVPDAPITLIPSYPDLPMEYVYERVPRGSVPQVFLREGPRGSRTVYFPMDLDRTFWDVMLEDHGRLIANAVRWAANEEPPVSVAGPGLLDITVWRQPAAAVVHLVNFTNPMMLKGPIRELIPVGAQKLRVRVPRPARAVRLLVAGTQTPFQNRAGAAEFTVPSVLDHEVAVVEL